MKIVYLAHPIGGDVEGNLAKLVDIGRQINLTEPNTVPFVPYYYDIHCLRDDVPEERARGLRNGIAILRSGAVQEVRLYGDRISNGMTQEIYQALRMRIPVVPMTQETQLEYQARWGELPVYPIDTMG